MQSLSDLVIPEVRTPRSDLSHEGRIQNAISNISDNDIVSLFQRTL
jgi:hypothetical protein